MDPKGGDGTIDGRTRDDVGASVVPINAPGAEDAVFGLLAAGGLAALPTETVYGLACDAGNAEAVATLFAAKGRPPTNPLICHVADLAAAERIAVFDDQARAVAAAFWPGPLTLVLPRRPGAPVAAAVTAGRDTVAVRVPDAPLMRRLAARLGHPIAAPSANRSGRITATTAAAVVAELGDRVPLVVDGGQARLGLESTIVGLLGGAPRLLRPGALDAAAIEAVLGTSLVVGAAADEANADAEREPGADAEIDGHDVPGARGDIPPGTPRATSMAAAGGHAEAAGAGGGRRSGGEGGDGAEAMLAPGRLASHYAPSAALRLDVTEVRPGEALLAFGPVPPAGAGRAVATINLSESGDPHEAAARLYEALRALDASGCATIAVAPIPGGGIATAIRDRLARAAAPR